MVPYVPDNYEERRGFQKFEILQIITAIYNKLLEFFFLKRQG